MIQVYFEHKIRIMFVGKITASNLNSERPTHIQIKQKMEESTSTGTSDVLGFSDFIDYR